MSPVKTTLALSLAMLPLFAQGSNPAVNQPSSHETAPNVFGSAAQANPLPQAIDKVAARAGSVNLTPSSNSIVADAQSTMTVVITVEDLRGAPLAGETVATVELKNGVLLNVEDLDKTTPGTQVKLRDGRATLTIKAPAIQQDLILRVTVGGAQRLLTIKALPHLRDMVAAGVVEIRGHLNKLPPGGIVPARENDLFEKELLRHAEAFNNEKGHVGARAAFYLKGKILGEYLLTAMYDSDKDTRSQQFRDIQPDKFYPVYGDSSIKGVDAQSSNKLFVRIDSNRSYILYGDYSAQEGSITQLGNYSRGLNGVKWHVESANGNVKGNVFASYDSLKQVVDEFRAAGVSGPYAVTNTAGIAGSERVEIIVRDRNQPAVILRTTLMTRYDDYEFEPFNGRIVFNSPVASLDANLNPVFIRVTYEIESGGQKFLVAGANVNAKVNDNLTLAATYAKDENPLSPYQVGSVAAQVKAGKFTGEIEAAQSQGKQDGTVSTQEGNAYRVGLAYTGEVVNAGVTAIKTDPTFSNNAGGASPGRQELNARVSAQVSERVKVSLEGLKSEDLVSGGYRQAGSLNVELKATDKLSIELGVKQGKDVVGTGPVPSVSTCGFNGYNSQTGTCNNGSPFAGSTGSGGLAGALPGNEVTAAHLKISYQMTPAAKVYIETDVSTDNNSARMIAIGGDVAVTERTRIYGRLEDTNSSSGSYGLTNGTHQRQGVIGVSSDYMTDGQVFNEYRISDSLSSQRSENALGLRNGFKINEGLRLNTSVEYLRVLTGTGSDAKAVGLGLEYTGSKIWKGSGKLELRQDDTSNNILTTVTAARKLSNDWTLLARNYNATQLSRTSSESRHQNQFQVGFAYRPQDNNRFNLLAKYEYRSDTNSYTASAGEEHSHIASVHTDWHPSRRWTVNNRFAIKQRLDTLVNPVGGASFTDRWTAYLAGGRVSYDVTERWTVGGMATLLTSAKEGTQYGYALEAGYIVAPNTLFNIGYNIRGLKSKDPLTNDYSNRGWYFGLRFKFDENLFSGSRSDKNLTLEPSSK